MEIVNTRGKLTVTFKWWMSNCVHPDALGQGPHARFGSVLSIPHGAAPN